LGVALGILLSVHFSAVADQESKTPIPYEDLQLLAAVFGKIKSTYVDPVPDNKLIREAINGMVRGLDPHSDFLEGRELEDLKISTQGKFGGLGIEINGEGDVIRIVSPIEDTPAFRAGIKAGDLIVKIDDTVTRGLPMSKALDMMRGKPGTSVTLTIARKDEAKPLIFKLVREEINVKSIRYKMVEPGYGYVRIRNFQERTGEELAQALKALYKEATLKGLVLDLRSDPGGLLSQAVAVSAAFLPKDVMVVYTEGRTPEARMELKARQHDYLGSMTGRGLLAKDYLADLPAAVKTVPMVVLIDAGSASASEIVAGALQDHQRALVMGAQSFGKGSVQTIMQIDATHALKLTTARYFTPSGRSIQAKGIEPDVAVDDGRDVLRIREANLEHHMLTPKNGKKEAEEETAKAAPTDDKEGDKLTPPPRFDFGAPEDFQLQQALNQLKGLPVIAALKKEEKKDGAEKTEKAVVPEGADAEKTLPEAPKAPTTSDKP